MTTKYLLACRCGKNTAVDKGMAGRFVQCACGDQLDVPALRELTELPHVEHRETISRKRWGLHQSLVFFGAILFLGGTAFGGYLHFNPPPYPEAIVQEEFERISDTLKMQSDFWEPPQTRDRWHSLRIHGEDLPESEPLPVYEHPAVVKWRDGVTEHEMWVKIIFGIAGLGLIMSLSMQFISNRKPPNSVSRLESPQQERSSSHVTPSRSSGRQKKKHK